MATPKKDWKKEWEAVSKESRKLAKRANQRLVRLEHYSEREGLSEILKFAYANAQEYIGKNLGGKRYKEHVKLYDVSDGTKNLTGDALYKANVMIQRNRIKAMQEFLGSESSTLGQSRAGVKTKGIRAIFDKRTNTINEKFLKKYGVEICGLHYDASTKMTEFYSGRPADGRLNLCRKYFYDENRGYLLGE